MRSRSQTRPRPLDVYKKLPLLRKADEELIDELGASHKISLVELGKEEEQAAATQPQRKKLNIPTPVVGIVADYEKLVAATYAPPVSYIRLNKRTADDATKCEYVADHADTQWLAQLNAAGRKREPLDEDKFEHMIETLEKATGTGSVVTLDQAGSIMTTKLSMAPTSASREIIAEVHTYWLSKRNKLGKPVLRRFWATTAIDDTNPHLVFRPREKERYKLRKHRKNDMESFRKMQQLRRDCERVRDLVDLVRHRERLKQTTLMLHEELFEQQMHELSKADGAPARSSTVNLDELRRQLATLRAAVRGPEDKDDRPAKKIKRRKNRRRAEGDGDLMDLDEMDGVAEKLGLDAMDSAAAGDTDEGGKRAIELPPVPHFMDDYPGRASAARLLPLEPHVRVYAGEPVPPPAPADPAPSTTAGGAAAANGSSSSPTCAPACPSASAGEPAAAADDSSTVASKVTAAAGTSDVASGAAVQPLSFFCPPSVNPPSPLYEAGLAPPETTEYRCRGRIGRGGRVIIDRVPLRRSAEDPDVVVVGSAAGSRYRKLPRRCLPGQGLRRATPINARVLTHVYNLSDSEDEELAPRVLRSGLTSKYELSV